MLPAIGGILVDKFGIRKCIFFFNILLVFGQAICTFAAYIVSFDLMLFGRVIYGSSVETLFVAICKKS